MASTKFLGLTTKFKQMNRYIILLMTVIGFLSCSEEDKSFVLSSKPTVLRYGNYKSSIEQNQTWSSGVPTVRAGDEYSFELTNIKFDERDTIVDAFQINPNGVISLGANHNLAKGMYTLGVKVSNQYGSMTRQSAINLIVRDSLSPSINIKTKKGSSNVNLFLDPSGIPVDSLGNVLETAFLPDVEILCENMEITQVLMTPGDKFLLRRSGDLLEEDGTNKGVLQMIGPFSPKEIYRLSFTGTNEYGTAEEKVLTVCAKKLNLPYNKQLFVMDFSGEPSGLSSRIDLTEIQMGGMQTHLVYGELNSGKAFWNTQGDKNNPHPEHNENYTFARYLTFNAKTGFDDDGSNKSQSIMITAQTFDMKGAQEIRVKSAIVAQKGADLSSGDLRVEMRMVSEEDYQVMLGLDNQEAKKEAINEWKIFETTNNNDPLYGVADNTGWGYWEFNSIIAAQDLPESISGKIRVLFNIVSERQGANKSFVAPETLEIEGTFLDDQE